MCATVIDATMIGAGQRVNADPAPDPTSRERGSMADPILTEKDVARFWSKVQRDAADKCWEWTRAKDKRGYGAFGHGGLRHQVMRAAHRIAYQITHGPIPDGCFISSIATARRWKHLGPPIYKFKAWLRKRAAS